MFHAAGWGLPFAGALAGVKFVYSAINEPRVLCELMNREKVTHSAGVPTVWLAMFQHMDATGEAPEHLKHVTIGGSAAPRAMIERIMEMGVARQSSLGHDRNLADRHAGRAVAALGRSDLRRAGRSGLASRARCRSESSCAWSTTKAPNSRATARVRAAFRSAGRG